MISFNYESEYQLVNENLFSNWISSVIVSESALVGEINFIFCIDSYLLEINRKFLDHDTLTDIITFDYTEDKLVSGDVFISVERVDENSKTFEVKFEVELRRVMAHGILHLLGYGDKSESESKVMRAKEDEKMKLFHVEQ